MISNFSEEAQNILIKAKLEMLELKHPYIGTEHLVLAILSDNSEITKKLASYNLTYEGFKKEIIKIVGKGSKKSEFFLHTPLLKKVIANAVIDSKENNNGIVTPEHLFSATLEVGEGIAIRTLIAMNVNLDELYDEFSGKIFNCTNKSQKLLINELGINLNNCAKNHKFDPLYGRENEILRIEEILCRKNKNNPLLIGPPGTGKTAIIEGLAALIEENKVPEQLSNKKIISVDMASLVAGTKYRGEFEERMKRVLKEIENDNSIILFIDEIHTLVGAGGAEGAIDASNILKPALARGKIKLIGATTTEEYKKHFENDKALERRFQSIIIEEPSIAETHEILHNLKPIYERYHQVSINDTVIDELIALTEKYITGKFRPDKEIDILDEACSKVNIKANNNECTGKQKLLKIRDRKNKYIQDNNIMKAYKYKLEETEILQKLKDNNKINDVKIEDIATVISNKTKLPIGSILNKNNCQIKKIHTELKKQILGQSTAIENIVNILKRKNITDKKNISLLFVGKNGIGKSKTAQIIANIISNNNIIKLDMSNYNESTSISRLIGASAGLIGYDNQKHILNTIKDHPNTTLILENIDKCHPKIIDLITEILREGTIKDAANNQISFTNTNIIMTTNKCANSPIGFNKATGSTNINEYFKDYFINSIDGIIYFKSLGRATMIRIIKNKLSSLRNKYPGIKITFTSNILLEILEESNYQTAGAQKIEKIINNIENTIIDSLINKADNIIIDSIFNK